MASPRSLAASMAMDRFSFNFFWPAKSARLRGRSPASNCASSGWRAPETSSRSGIRFSLTYQFQGAPEERLEFSVGGGGRSGDTRFADGSFGGGPRAAQ